MTARESNRRIMAIFVLCSLSIVAVTWTVSAKFIADAKIALAVNIVVGVCIGLLFGRYLEAKLNASVDFLMGKLHRVAAGDLTQRFKEEPDDIMPCGLSFELGEMIKFFKENIGDLWKTTSILTKQLDQFVASTAETLADFRREVAYLGSIGESLESVRKEAMEMAKKLSDLRVNAVSSTTLMDQIGELTEATPVTLGKNREALRIVGEEIENLSQMIDNIKSFLQGFAELSYKISGIEKAMTDLRTESHLVNLNTSIDAIREPVDDGNRLRLVQEARELAAKIVAITQESGSTFALSNRKVRDLVGKLDAGSRELRTAIEGIGRSGRLLVLSNEKSIEAASGYVTLSDSVKRLNELVAAMDAKAFEFGKVVKSSTGKFDKLSSDAQMTLIQFEQIEGKITAIKEGLGRLAGFKNLFTIA